MRMAMVSRHERVGAYRALELGMISEVVDPPERLHSRAQELAEQIASNPTEAVRSVKLALWASQESGP